MVMHFVIITIGTMYKSKKCRKNKRAKVDTEARFSTLNP